jgi:hypothetical protein
MFFFGLQSFLYHSSTSQTTRKPSYRTQSLSGFLLLLKDFNVSAPISHPVSNHSGKNISFEHISQKSIHKLHHFHVPIPMRAVKLHLQFNLSLLSTLQNVIQNGTFVMIVMNHSFFFSIFNDIVVMTIVRDVLRATSNLLQEML